MNADEAPQSAPARHRPRGKRCPLIPGKLLLLAVGMSQAGKLVIVPIDLDHEGDDQSSNLSKEEAAQCQGSKEYLYDHLPELAGGLEHLYRPAFRSFENFRFALLGMARSPTAKEHKARERVKPLLGSSGQQAKGSL